jgi:hypothetical protein
MSTQTMIGRNHLLILEKTAGVIGSVGFFLSNCGRLFMMVPGTRKKGTRKGDPRSPAKKRTRLSGSISERNSVSKGKSRSKSLSMLLFMPMDILFEVSDSCIRVL